MAVHRRRDGETEEDLVPRYKFKWSNLPQSLLRDLCRDLLDMPQSDREWAEAMQLAYGARPSVEFLRDGWPTVLQSWLRTADDSRERVVHALQEARGEKSLIKGPRAQMTYLRELRNSKNLREVVWNELIAAGEVERVGPRQRNEKDTTMPTMSTLRSHKLPSTTAAAATVNNGDAAGRQKKPQQEKSLEATLWEAADRLRSRVDAAEYKHVVLGLIFL
jgi:hypothetical protein